MPCLYCAFCGESITLEQNSNDSTDHPGWLEITIDVDPSAREACSAFLMDMGCDGVVSEDFEDASMKAYLPKENNPEAVRKNIETFLSKLTELFPEIPAPVLDIREIANQDWGTSWRSFFYLEKITDNLMILPAWEAMPDPVNCHVIRIDPGTAFGTGKHESTRMCLQATEENVPGKPWTMLDVGTGSGILSVYGAMLGAKEITAIDIDPEAVRWAEKNIDLNEIPVKIDLSTTPLEEIEKQYDIVAANLIKNTILELNPFFPNVLAPDGLIIFSGILKEQISMIQEDISKYGLIRISETIMGEWACLLVKKA
ncbi:MAG: 50S ribosomal protein L11 methyltransferase [Desulfobacteraceae bacterium]|jgi:ribosomal protein L11 methyltransferase